MPSLRPFEALGRRNPGRSLYPRRLLQEGTGEETVAGLYLWKFPESCEGEWSLEQFQASDKATYVDMVSSFVAKELPGLLELRRKVKAGEVVVTNGEGKSTKSYLDEKGSWGDACS